MQPTKWVIRTWPQFQLSNSVEPITWRSRPTAPPAWKAITPEELPLKPDPPAAWHPMIATLEDTPVQIDLTIASLNPTNPEPRITASPRFGQFEGEPPMVIYVPQTNSIGVDEFSFIIVGPEDFAVDLAGMIEVMPVNDPPTAGAFSAVTEANTPVVIDLIADDPDTDVLHFGLVEWPIHGTLSGDPPNLVYHPAPDFEGGDQFSYRADDGEFQSSEVSVGLTIVPLQVEEALRPVLTNVAVSTGRFNAHVGCGSRVYLSRHPPGGIRPSASGWMRARICWRNHQVSPTRSRSRSAQVSMPSG